MELLIVVAIIGILVSIATASYGTAQKKSRDTRRVSDMKSVQNAWEQYYADNNAAYPPGTDTGACDISMMTNSSTYLPGGLPKDPKTGAEYIGPVCSSKKYCFCATLEIATSGMKDCYGAATTTLYCVSNLQ